MSKTARYNLTVAPIVILVRVPLLLPIWILVHAGKAAERLGNWIGYRLPGFKR